MPARYYTFEEPVPGAAGTNDARKVQFFVLDSQACWNEEAAFHAQLAWLERELTRSRAHWKLVAGHHCILSGGEHGPIRELARELEPLLGRHGVDLYLSGHDHDLQLLRSDAGWLQLVSGSGSSTRDTGWTEESLFAAAAPGFAALELTGDELRIHLCEAGRGPTFSHVVRKGAPLLASRPV
jgi:acid phosphatase